MDTDKKYELLIDDIIEVNGHTLYRIIALKDFGNIKKGDLGGYIEKDYNLSHNGNCFVYSDAKVYGNAEIFDNVKVHGNAEIYGNAKIIDNVEIFNIAKVHGNAIIRDNVKVYGSAEVCRNARLYDNTKVYGNAIVRGSSKIFGNATLSNNAYISNTNDYITIGPIGSRNGFTTFYKTKDKDIWVKCGCFNDSIKTFKKKVKKVHKDTIYEKQYMNTIKYVESLLL